MSQDALSQQSQEKKIESCRSGWDSVGNLLRKAIGHHEAGRLDKASSLYKQVLEQAPEDPHALMNLGIIHNSRMELQEALGYYRRLLAVVPDHFQAVYNFANACRDEGLVAEAVAAYQKALAIEPGHPDVLLNLGIAYYLENNASAAAGCYEQVLTVDPNCHQAHYNLGLIRFDQKRLPEAIACYERALGLIPDDVDTLFNLGLALQKAKRLPEAAARLEEAVRLAPDDAEFHNTLGTIYKAAQELERAEAGFRRALAIKPGYGAAWTNLAIVLHILGRIDEALAAYRQAMALGHNVVAAEYMIAALSGDARKSAPRQYVTELFDNYAAGFDKSLTEDLGYKTPSLLRQAVGAIAPGPFARVLDLGCGTGLAGEAFRDMAGHLSGVDLSPAMLEEAARKGIYDALAAADLVEYLAGATVHYDLMVAADVLIYLGELEPLFAAVRSRLTGGGRLAFSTESYDRPNEYCLRQSGRYAYHPGYIEEMARRYRFTTEYCGQEPVRMERGAWIAGHLFVLRLID